MVVSVTKVNLCFQRPRWNKKLPTITPEADFSRLELARLGDELEILSVWAKIKTVSTWQITYPRLRIGLKSRILICFNKGNQLEMMILQTLHLAPKNTGWRTCFRNRKVRLLPRGIGQQNSPAFSIISELTTSTIDSMTLSFFCSNIILWLFGFEIFLWFVSLWQIAW